MGLSRYKVGAGLAVSDMDRAREFYEGKLGLSVSIDSGDNVQYRCAEGTVLRLRGRLFRQPPRRGLLGYSTKPRGKAKALSYLPRASKSIRFFYLTRRFQSPPEPPQLGVPRSLGVY